MGSKQLDGWTQSFVGRTLARRYRLTRVIGEGGATLARRETVVEGVKAQRFVFDFEPPEATRPSRSEPQVTRRGPPSAPVIGLTTVGVLALGSFGYFGISGLSQRSDIESCSPNCARSQVDDGQRSLLIADVSLGVAALALGGALVLYLTQPRVAETASRQRALLG